MTPEQLATRLDEREYGEETTPEIEKVAKDAGLVIVFGASDDLMEFRGAINEEVGAYGGHMVLLCPIGLLVNDCKSDECPHFTPIAERAVRVGATIEAKWDTEGFSWVYETPIPHAAFRIVEDGENYCRGIVFRLKDVS